MNSCNIRRQSRTHVQVVSLKIQRFLKYIYRQLDTLKDERNTMQLAADEYISQMEIEVDKWVKGGQINQASFAEISNMLQQSITFFAAKSVDIIGLQNGETSTEEQKSSASNIQDLNVPGDTEEVKYKQRTEQSETKAPNKGKDNSAALEADNTHINTRLTILEEAIFSVKRKTEHVQEKQDNVQKILDNFLTQQENIKKCITEFEKILQDLSSNVDHLIESIANIDNRLNKLDEEKESINIAINDVNTHLTCFRTKTQDDLKSLEKFSREHHSAYEHCNELSSKINKLQVSFDLMSTKHKEVCANKYSQNKVTFDDLRDDLTSKVMDLSNKVSEIKSRCCRSSVGFYAFKKLQLMEGQFALQDFEIVNANYGNHFDPISGKFTAPISRLYLVSITAKLEEKSSIVVLHRGHGEIEVCTLFGKQTITCCYKLSEGETISLKLVVNKERTETWVDFSSCLINGS